jgi:hypothetical protein
MCWQTTNSGWDEDLLRGELADLQTLDFDIDRKAMHIKRMLWFEKSGCGLLRREPIPHPDDIIIDSKTGEIRFDGPVLEEQWMAGERLRAMWPELERMLRQVNEKLESDSNNSELRKQQEDLTKWVGWLMKDEGRRAMRDALRRPPGKPKED